MLNHSDSCLSMTEWIDFYEELEGPSEVGFNAKPTPKNFQIMILAHGALWIFTREDWAAILKHPDK